MEVPFYATGYAFVGFLSHQKLLLGYSSKHHEFMVELPFSETRELLALFFRFERQEP